MDYLLNKECRRDLWGGIEVIIASLISSKGHKPCPFKGDGIAIDGGVARMHGNGHRKPR